MKWLFSKQEGSILLPFVILLPSFILIASLYMSLTVSNYRVAKRDQYHTHAQFAADAGADYAVDQVNTNEAWAATASPIEIHNDGKVRVTYEASVTGATDEKVVTSIGKTYSPTTSTTPQSRVTIRATLRPVSSGEYSVVGGVGGLIMSNSAKILGGDVYVNGKITLTNSAQIGLTTSSVRVNVAHKSCPQPATSSYPRICNSGENGQPISLSVNAKIYGEVEANNQTSGTNMFNPGLTASSGVLDQPLPSYDRDAQKAAVASTISGAIAGCSSGTKTWANNLKITGDVSISGTCKITVSGNVWITGKLTMLNSSQLIVSDTLGTTRPVIMIDGELADFKNSALLKSNASGTGFEVITYKSTAGCSPDCSDVTGTDLANSQGVLRISLINSASGPNTIFYSRWGKVKITNNGQLGALIGQTVELANSGSITFGTSAGVGTNFWVVDGYRRVFN